jgi:hypothetical protein
LTRTLRSAAHHPQQGGSGLNRRLPAHRGGDASGGEPLFSRAAPPPDLTQRALQWNIISWRRTADFFQLALLLAAGAFFGLRVGAIALIWLAERPPRPAPRPAPPPRARNHVPSISTLPEPSDTPLPAQVVPAEQALRGSPPAKAAEYLQIIAQGNACRQHGQFALTLAADNRTPCAHRRCGRVDRLDCAPQPCQLGDVQAPRALTTRRAGRDRRR